MKASFGNILLPDFLLVDLFKDNLVICNDTITGIKPILPTTKVTKPLVAEIVIKPIKKEALSLPKKYFLGDNNKHIIILVNDVDAVYLRDEWLQFLTNILGACKLNIGDVAIINHANNPINFTQLNEQLVPQYFLLFDVAVIHPTVCAQNCRLSS